MKVTIERYNDVMELVKDCKLPEEQAVAIIQALDRLRDVKLDVIIMWQPSPETDSNADEERAGVPTGMANNCDLTEGQLFNIFNDYLQRLFILTHKEEIEEALLNVATHGQKPN